jgi:hypothetical protein
MKGCENIAALTKEVGVSRRQLYRWRDELDPEDPGVEKPLEQKSHVSTFAQRGQSFKANSGGEDAGSGFFQKCRLGPAAAKGGENR